MDSYACGNDLHLHVRSEKRWVCRLVHTGMDGGTVLKRDMVTNTHANTRALSLTHTHTQTQTE